MKVHLLKTKTKKGDDCVVVYYFLGKKMYRKWLVGRDLYRLSFYENNLIEAIEIDSSKNVNFPEIKETKYSRRRFSIACPHTYVDTDLDQKIFICTGCGHEIEF